MDPIDLAKSVKPITAYHGSPHDFDQFDTSKIGTGEGAQAYGHGLYFAEHEPVAKGYREFLSSRQNNLTDPANLAASMVYRTPDGTRESGIAELQRLIKSIDRFPAQYKHDPTARDVAVKALEHLQSSKDLPPQGGHMYEVHIDAHPDHFLDWDKPLRDQHEKIRRLAGWTAEHEAAHKAVEKVDNDNLSAALEGNGDYTPMKFPPRPHGVLPLSATGADVYEHIKNKMGAIDWPIDADHDTREKFRKSASERASQYLSDNGIHGIRYLDAGSRGATEQPTHNYVVFDHNRVNVKRKYAKGGSVRRPYKKGGKVEGSVWHERDAFDDGGTTGDPRGPAEARGLGDSVGPSEQAAPEQKAPEFSRDLSEAEKLANEGDIPSWAGHNSGPNEAAVRDQENRNASAAMAAGAKLNAAANAAEAAEAPPSAESVANQKIGFATTSVGSPPSAASVAEQKMATAFGTPATTDMRLNQFDPRSNDVFSTPATVAPQHYESTLESNLVEPAWSQPTPSQPIAPHTPTPDTAYGSSAPATPFTQPTAPHSPTPDTAYNVAQPAAPFQPNANAAFRQARDTIPQNMGFSPQPQQTIAASQPASIPMTGNVPLPPINPTTITGTGPVADFVQGITGLFGMNAEQQIGRKQTGYADQGMNPYDAYTHAQYDVLGAQRAGAESAAAAGHGGGPQNKMVQKLMPDGTYQWVQEPYKKGGKVYRKLINSGIVDHVITKFGAKLPASNQQSTGNTAGRRR